jgi:Flp pilus assembly protein TadG
MRPKHCLSSINLQKQNHPGQTLVEFALLIPLFLFLLLGFFDLGRAWFYRSSLSNAVREGARAGIVIPYDEQVIQDIVRDYAFGLTGADTTLTITSEVVPTNVGDALQIDATFCYQPVTPGIIRITGSSCSDGTRGITLSATSVMMLFEPGN